MTRIASPLASVAFCCALLLMTVACGATDPRLDDLRVSGSVAALDGTPLVGAEVELVRTPCAGGVCSPRIRGVALTDAGARFEIVVERDAAEESSWELVCQEFTISVEASGYVPVVGNYQAWRGPFCASGEAVGIEFRLEPMQGAQASPAAGSTIH